MTNTHGRLDAIEDRLAAEQAAYGGMVGDRLGAALDVAEGCHGPDMTPAEAAAILAPAGGPEGYRALLAATDTAGEGSIPPVFAECCAVAIEQLTARGYPAPPGAFPQRGEIERR